MQTLYKYFSHHLVLGLLAAMQLGCALGSRAQSFTPGNLVVLQVGDGSGTPLTNASAPVTLQEYTPAGTPRSKVILNATGTDNKLTVAGNGPSEGGLTLAASGLYLLATGYNTGVGTTSVSTTTASAVARTVARIDGNLAVDISTVLPDAFSGSNIRGAASTDGTGFFLAGAAASTAVTPTTTNARAVHVYRNQVFYSTGAGSSQGIYLLNAATATGAGQVATPFLITGTSATTAASPYDFLLLDRDPGVVGIDAAYVADENAGIQKWSFDGSAWASQGAVGPPSRNLAGLLNADGSVAIYATTRTAAGSNQLIALTDNTAYNSAPGMLATTTIATAATNTPFRGVAFAPGTAVPLPVVLASLAARRLASGGIQVRWGTASEHNSRYFDVERSLDGHSFVPVGRVAAQGSTAQPHAYAYLDQGAPAALLYYRLHQLDADGTAAHSVPVVVAALPGEASPELLLFPNPAPTTLSLTTAAPTTYWVRNAVGQPLLTGTTASGTTTLRVAELPAGIYFLELHLAAGRVVRKFVRE